MILLILFKFAPATISAILLLCLLLALYIGVRMGLGKNKGESEDKTSSNLISGVFALNAFLLGFTFSMSASRYEARRDVLVQESNDIGTAILRIDLYPDSMQQLLRPLFRDYVESRIAYYSIRGDTGRLTASVNSSNAISARIWNHCTAHFRQTGSVAPTNLMIPSLNAMIDKVNTRQQQLYAIVPESIVLMLFVLTIASAFLAGYVNRKGKVDWPVAAGFCILTAFVIYITLDLDRPRRGLINLDVAEKSMVDLRQNFK